jgi:hypothetical protein
MKRTTAGPSPLLAGLAPLLLAALSLAACDGTPTTAAVTNAYPTTTVFKVWWVATLFATPVAPGDSSEIERTIPGDDYAYALLAPGWLPGQSPPPAQLVAVRSATTLSAAEHQRFTIEVSDDRFVGDCASGSLISADEASLIVERIFPGDFAGVSYDPTTCTSTPAR